MSEVERTVAAQVELYGEPLAEVFGRLTTGLGVSQAELARTLGISPPMLSQLGSGKRAKIGNPAAHRRLTDVLGVLDEVVAGRLHRDDVRRRLEAVRESTGSWTTTRPDLPGAATDDGAETVRWLLRSVASPTELAEATGRLAADHPALADILRTYGLGTAEEAAAHLAAQREGSASGD